MNSLDIRVASKVAVVEGENMFDAVHAHCRYQSRVVNPNPGYVLANEQRAPFLVDSHAVG